MSRPSSILALLGIALASCGDFPQSDEGMTSEQTISELAEADRGRLAAQRAVVEALIAGDSESHRKYETADTGSGVSHCCWSESNRWHQTAITVFLSPGVVFVRTMLR